MDFRAFWPFPFISELISWVHVVQQLSREALMLGLQDRPTFDQKLPRMPTVRSYIIEFDSASTSGHLLHMSLLAFAAFQHLSAAPFAAPACVGGRKTSLPSRYHLA